MDIYPKRHSGCDAVLAALAQHVLSVGRVLAQQVGMNDDLQSRTELAISNGTLDLQDSCLRGKDENGMYRSALIGLVLLGAYGLSACSSSDTPSASTTDADAVVTPAPTPTPTNDDACSNYPGVQVAGDITPLGFVVDTKGECQLARNHAALALSGIDVVRLAGWTGKGVSVAVIDSGYRASHEAIRSQVLAVASYHDLNANFRLDSNEKQIGDASPLVGAHGTAVAALMAGAGVGAAPGAGLWLKAVGDENPYVRDLAIANQDALQGDGLTIVNHSTDLFSNTLIYRNAENDASGILSSLTTSQAVIVAAGGNTGLDLSEALDTAQQSTPDLSSFLDQSVTANHVILAGVYDETTQDAAVYSNTPGHRPSVQSRFVVTGGETLDSASSGADNAYRRVSGTSFSSPMIAGALAILREAKPSLSTMEAAHILLETARRPADLGYGQTCTSTTVLGVYASDCGAMKFGRGIMDVSAALQQVIH